METLQTEGAATTSVWPYSGFWRRVAAMVIDNLILIVPTVLLGMFTFGIGSLLVLLAYGTYFESSKRRATWGKQACGLTVESVSGETLSVGAALARQVLKFIGNIFSIVTWLIFFVPVVFTNKKQGLHDLAVSSVVRHEPGKGIPNWLVGVIACIVPAVFVMGILAAIAIPAYHDYVMRAKVAQGRMAAAPLREAVQAAFAKDGKLPLDESQFDKISAMTYVPEGNISVAYRNGRIEISLGGNQKGMLYLMPSVDAGRVTWKCGAENVRAAQLPVDCR